MIYTDQLGRKIELAHPPRKIVSTVPSQTELLFDLGLEKEIAGRTKFCIHPADKVKQVEKIGGTKNLNLEKIKSLAPDLIIANKEENMEEEIDELAKHFPVWISDIQNMDDALGMIQSVGEITERSKEASAIITTVKNNIQQLSAAPSLTVAYMIWYNPYMTIGSDTFIHHMLSLAGYKNVFSSQTRYPQVTLEQILAHKPDYLFLSSEPYPFKEKHIAEIQGMYPTQKVTIVDGEMFSWYGSRMLKAFNYFEKLRKEII